MTERESMILRLLGETPLTAAEAASRCKVQLLAVLRWIKRGKPAGASAGPGNVVKLEGYQSGRSWVTTVEALARFLAASTRLEPEPAKAPTSEYTRARRAKRDLERFELACARLMEKAD